MPAATESSQQSLEQVSSDLMKALLQKDSAASLPGMGLTDKSMAPENIRVGHQASGSKALFAFPRTGMGRKSGKVKDPGPLPHPRAWMEWEGGHRQLCAKVSSVYSTPFMNSRNSVKREAGMGQR
jgi:hypothetical protein